jgi:pimeloyl-ACP methyl ester carboxylesterase
MQDLTPSGSWGCEPTWSYLYRHMIPVLRERFRCVAPDYIGFGRSDKWTDVGAYTFARHFAMLERLVETLDLRRLTVVVQDWGGPLGLRLAARHPELIARLVVLNSGLFTGEADTLSPGLRRWRDYALRTPDLPVGQIIRRSVVDRASVPDAVVAAYDAPFPTLESKAGARVPGADSHHAGGTRCGRDARDARRARALGQAGAGLLEQPRSGVPGRRGGGDGPADSLRALRSDRGRRPLSPGGEGRRDRAPDPRLCT